MDDFLRYDLRDALAGLFVGAVLWQANPESSDRHGVRGAGMFMSFVQARALYEFFFKSPQPVPKIGDNATARDFIPSWSADDCSGLYKRYMTNGSPAQKRVFHLVYGRSGYSGGDEPDESDHLKNQVLDFAEDIRRLTQDFAALLPARWGSMVQDSLSASLTKAHEVETAVGVQVPQLA